MKKSVLVAAMLAAWAGLSALVWAMEPGDAKSADEVSPASENIESLIGRRALEEQRTMEAGLELRLPESCPPFYLRDEYGKIIDPNFEPDVNRPVSMRETCKPCHDVGTVTQGYHFQMGYDEMYVGDPEETDDQPPLDKGPGLYGKWQLLYQRELAYRHFEDPADIDMTPFDWVVNCGVCHPGGGPGEFDRSGRRYSDVMGRDPEVGHTRDSDYYGAQWNKSGVLGPDCLICHLETYTYSLRAQQIKKWNFQWAATEAAGLGQVEGSVKDGEIPHIKFNKSLFLPDGKVHLKIRRPSDRACLFCHDISGIQKRGTTWHSHYIQDVHTQQHVSCTQCHPGDIRHNFAKGHSTTQTVRDDLDGSMMSCQECHYETELGAPFEAHMGIPPLHFKRMSCQSCHVTRRPFLSARVIDTLTGKAIALPNAADVRSFDNYRFGATWGHLSAQGVEGTLRAFSADEIQQAANLDLEPGDPLREVYARNSGFAPLPQESFVVGDFLKADEGPGIVDTPEKRTLLLFALESVTGSDDAACVFRGEAYRLDEGQIETLPVTLTPDRIGKIAEYPITYGLGADPAGIVDGGIYYPEGYQLGVFWVHMDNDIARPLFLSDMARAWEFLESVELTLHTPGQPDRTLKVWDDNNDTWPEVNTEEEMGLVGWALTHTLERITEPDLYFIKGTNAYRVRVEDSVPRDMDTAAQSAETPAGTPYLSVLRKGDSKKDIPDLTITAPMYVATVETVDPATTPAVHEFAQRLTWSIGHGIEPARQALGLGIKGCVDCHEFGSQFFAASVVVDPFGPDGRPVIRPAYEAMGLTERQLKYASFREVHIKEEGHWLLIVVIGLCVLHFITRGPRLPIPMPGPQDRTVLFSRFHERVAYWAAAGSVTVLGLSAIGFRMTGQTNVGAGVREIHHVMGVIGTVAFAVFFLMLLPYMFPDRYDFARLRFWRRGPVPSGKYTTGEKLLFWGTMLTLAGVAASGMVIWLTLEQRTTNQQLMYMLHDGFALLAVCFIFVHMYMMLLVHPLGLLRVFGGRMPRAWAETFRSGWKPRE